MALRVKSCLRNHTKKSVFMRFRGVFTLTFFFVFKSVCTSFVPFCVVDNLNSFAYNHCRGDDMKGGTIRQNGKKWLWRSPPCIIDGKTVPNSKTFNTREEAELQQKTLPMPCGKSRNTILYMMTWTRKDCWSFDVHRERAMRLLSC